MGRKTRQTPWELTCGYAHRVKAKRDEGFWSQNREVIQTEDHRLLTSIRSRLAGDNSNKELS